jgi:hypothetical protein
MDVHASEQRDLRTDAGHAHRHARAALDDPAASPLVAIAWLSTHLGAVERVVYPAAQRRLPDGPARVVAQLRTDHRLHEAAYRLDRYTTGDVHLGGASRADLVDAVRRSLDEHEAGELALLDDLCAALEPAEQTDLAERMARTLLRSPTRPHPNVHHGRMRGVALWAEGIVDRTRDLLDSRVVPTPRRPVTPRAVTRWGAYVTGATVPSPHWLDAPERKDSPTP